MDLLLEQGIALQRQGDLARAEALYKTVLCRTPDSAPALHYLGLVNFQAGKLEAADRFMSRSVDLDRSCANTWNDLGAVKLKSGKLDDALRHFVCALELDINHTDALNNMAIVCKRLFQFEKALIPLRRLALLRPKSGAVARDLADVLYHAGFINEAVVTYHDAVRLDPDNTAARLGIAEACEAAGKFKQAKMQYYSVLQRAPYDPLALSKLLQMPDGPVDPSWVTRAQQVAEHIDGEAEGKRRLNIGLAYYFDRIGSYNSAFHHLKLARDEQARLHPFDNEGYSAAVKALIDVTTKEFFRNASKSGVLSDRPIFIVGMPRSGTTLTEQILSTHSSVAAGGELAALPSASYRVLELSDAHRPYPYGLTSMSAASLGTLADAYLKKLATIDIDHRRVTDKLPFNFMHLGMVALLFPKAKIVHCRRDPMDNCTSCYFTSFADEVRFASDLETLGRYYADYHRLMEHWKNVLPLEICELNYESLVADTETTIRKLLDYCELEWEPACLKFYETQRGIRTPSRWQVRQPIYGKSVARWRHYEQYLGPLKQGLGRPLATEAGA